MNKITLYWLPHCSTCQKAATFLKARKDVEIEYRDIKANPLSPAEVRDLADLAGGPNEIFSRRARLYQSMGLANRNLTDDEILDLIAHEYTFVKRPLLKIGRKVVSGFASENYDKVLINNG